MIHEIFYYYLLQSSVILVIPELTQTLKPELNPKYEITRTGSVSLHPKIRITCSEPKQVPERPSLDCGVWPRSIQAFAPYRQVRPYLVFSVHSFPLSLSFQVFFFKGLLCPVWWRFLCFLASPTETAPSSG